ncbi:MAG: FAD-binding oxidoreductase [Planctomycetia bacterium]|nr:FAD-binding oxidoreductase [Planctomycetia bacterium]
MDPERARIHDDLRGVLAGDVRCDDLYLQLYSTDASIYQIRPLAVIAPRNTADVVKCAEYATKNRLPLIARGAGTGLAGEALGAGLVLDFSRYMTRVLEFGPDTVRVQPGVIHANLNRQLARRGRTFGPDPAMSTVTTMGSVAALDGSGSHWLKYGAARGHVQRLQIVLSDGTLMTVGQEPTETPDDPLPRRRHLVQELSRLIAGNTELIKQHQPKSCVNRSGYHLHRVLQGGQLDLAKLLVGSAGTLAMFTEITLATQPLEASRGVCLLLFDSLDSAARAVMEILPFSPSACDIIDRRHLSLAREHDVRFDLLVPSDTEAVLLVEVDGDNTTEVRDRLHQIIDRVHGELRLALGSRQAIDPQEVDFYWQLARRVVPTLYRLKGSSRPLPFVEDIAVPPAALPEFFQRMFTVLRRHQVTASLFGHAGHGQLHLRPFLNLADPADLERMQRLAEELYDDAIELGGTISGEHGDGLSRTSFIRRQYGPLYDVFREVKRIFDPDNLLNPGKVISDDPALLTQNLRPLLPESEVAATNGNGAATRPDESKAAAVPVRHDMLGTIELSSASPRARKRRRVPKRA